MPAARADHTCIAALLLALLFVDQKAGVLVLADEASLAFSDFELRYFETERSLITNRLASCGCVYWQALDSLTPPSGGSAADTPLSSLTQAETLLYRQLKSQLAQCQCLQGEQLVDAAVVATAAPGMANQPVTQGDAEAMVRRITQVLNNTYDACCDASKSTMDYHFMSGMYNFRSAEGDAPKKGGVLATIASREDEVNAFNALNGKLAPIVGEGGNGMFVWIGLRYTRGTLSWASGAQIDYKNFGIGEEGSMSDGCVAMAITRWSGTTSGAPGQWNVMDCGTALPYLLEYRITPETQQRVKHITIAIAVVLGCFLIASIAIVVKKVVSPACGGSSGAPRLSLRRLGATHRRRREGHAEDHDAPEAREMATIDPSPPTEAPQTAAPRQQGQRRRVHFPQPGTGPEEVGGPESYSPRTVDDAFSRDEGAARRVRSAAARAGTVPTVAPSKGLSVAERRLMAARRQQVQQQRQLLSQQQEQLRQRRAAAQRTTEQGAEIMARLRPAEGALPALQPSRTAMPQQQQLVAAAATNVEQAVSSSGPEASRPTTAPTTPDTLSLERRQSNLSTSGQSDRSVPAFQPLDLGEIMVRSPTSSPLGAQRPEDPLSFLDELPPASPDRERAATGSGPLA